MSMRWPLGSTGLDDLPFCTASGVRSQTATGRRFDGLARARCMSLTMASPARSVPVGFTILRAMWIVDTLSLNECNGFFNIQKPYFISAS